MTRQFCSLINLNIILFAAIAENRHSQTLYHACNTLYHACNTLYHACNTLYHACNTMKNQIGCQSMVCMCTLGSAAHHCNDKVIHCILK